MASRTQAPLLRDTMKAGMRRSGVLIGGFLLFLGVVLLCCVFFTLGYVMGKTQYGSAPVEAASIEKTPRPVSSREAQTTAQPPASPEWDFYAKKKAGDVPLKPAGRGEAASSHMTESASSSGPSSFEPAASAPTPVRHEIAPAVSRPAAAVPARFRAPRMSRNAVVLQVGALRIDLFLQSPNAGKSQGEQHQQNPRNEIPRFHFKFFLEKTAAARVREIAQYTAA